jgi:DNA-binding NtrC family response regulator
MTTFKPSERLNAMGRIAIIDDDADFSALLECHVEILGYAASVYTSGEEFLAALPGEVFSGVLLDIQMPGMDGLATLAAIRARNPHLPVIMVTADDQLESVVGCMRAGAYDYITKPPAPERLEAVLRNAREKYELTMEVIGLSREAGGGGYEGIVGRSPAIRRVFRMLDRVAATDISVLVRGESGTGKELVAQAIHRLGSRAAGPFVALNAAAIPESLIEAELFGHEKGAFTGAVSRRRGKFEEAHLGTLFLDEIGEIPLAMQAKLLRVIQERKFQRIGGTEELRSDFRLIAATHRNLANEVRTGRFREDLFYRIAVFDFEVPPLRDRREDIPILASRFIEDFRSVAGSPALRPSSAALEILCRYDWPGNVRELQNAIQRALVLCEGEELLPGHLPLGVCTRAATPDGGALRSPVRSGGATIEEIERNALEEALIGSRGNVSQAMRMLRMGRNRFYRKIQKYGLAELVERLRREA